MLAYYSWIPIVNAWTLFAPKDPVVPPQLLELLLYSSTALMFVLARRGLQAYRIDRFTLVAFLLFGSFLRIARAPSDPWETGITYCVFLPIALVVVFFAIRSRHARGDWAPVQLAWIASGLALGLAFGLVVARTSAGLAGFTSMPEPAAQLSLAGIAFTFSFAMGHSAILEEPVGRGFLWGFLEQRNWKPAVIWLVQAAVFWVSHLRYIESPFTFWAALPIGGLMFGWLSWRSGSVAAALLAHAAYNTVGAYY